MVAFWEVPALFEVFDEEAVSFEEESPDAALDGCFFVVPDDLFVVRVAVPEFDELPPSFAGSVPCTDFPEAEDDFVPAPFEPVPVFASAVDDAEFEEVSVFVEVPDVLDEEAFWPEDAPSEGDSNPATAVPDGASPLALAACAAASPVPLGVPVEDDGDCAAFRSASDADCCCPPCARSAPARAFENRREAPSPDTSPASGPDAASADKDSEEDCMVETVG